MFCLLYCFVLFYFIEIEYVIEFGGVLVIEIFLCYFFYSIRVRGMCVRVGGIVLDKFYYVVGLLGEG